MLPELFGLLACLTCASSQEFVIRATEQGDVRGYTVPFYEDPSMVLDVFTGVPYAQPPVGPLRFRYPEKAESWAPDVFNATSFSPCCPQILDNIRDSSFGPDYNNTEEDCLYLNIYAPRSVADEGEKYAVMVWIHGGSYRYGSGEEYDARVLAQQGVLVITINYRLGALAMLSTDDAAAPGNYGLMDCVLALQWVQDNIDNFGGDSNAVTVFGNSAGGGTVSLLMFSPLTEGLFHRVIAQSGDALSPWSIVRPPFKHRPVAERLAAAVGCPVDGVSSEDMVNCLRGIDAQVLAEVRVPSEGEFNAAWAPRIDGVFIEDSPENLLDEGSFHAVDFMSGTVPNEYSGEYPDAGEGWQREEKEGRMYAWTRRYLDRGEPADLLYLAMIQAYDLPGDDPQQQRDLFLEMRMDDSYVGPHTVHAQKHAEYVSNTYMYVFSYRSEGDLRPEWVGVPHGMEFYYTFGTALWDETAPCPWGCRNTVWFNSQQWSEADKQTARDVMAAWTNFAKTGNPSQETYQWPQYETVNEYFNEIGDTMTTKQYYKYNRMAFVNRYRTQLFDATVCANN